MECLDLSKWICLTFLDKIYLKKKILKLQEQGLAMNSRHPYLNCTMERFTNEYEGIKGGCTASVAGCSVLSDGNVIPCPFLRVSAGNVNKENLKDIWLNSEVFNKLRNRKAFDKCGECKYLSYCGGCRSSAYNKTKKLDGYDFNCIFEV